VPQRAVRAFVDDALKLLRLDLEGITAYEDGVRMIGTRAIEWVFL